MQCPRCNATLEDDTVFCGNCGNQVASVANPGATRLAVPEQEGSINHQPASVYTDYGRQGAVLEKPTLSASAPPIQVNTPLPPSDRPQRNNIGRIALIAIVILLVVAGGTIGLVSVLKSNSVVKNSNPASNAIGLVRFIDMQNGSPGHTDALHVDIESLPAAPAGFRYNAWFINEQSEQIFPLGTLVANGQNFSLDHANSGTNVLGLGNKLEVTLEQGNVSAPVGKVILSGTFPPLAFIHIRHLLLSFPTTPGKVGLLVGLQVQAQLLNSQATLLQSIVANPNTFAIQCAAQSMIDIIEGKHGSDYHPLASGCGAVNINATGDGFGLLGNGNKSGYVSAASNHASLAASRSDSTNLIRGHAGHVVICMTNMSGWLTTVEQDLLKLLAHPQDTSKIQEIVMLTDHAYHGVDTNGDGQVDPVPGEGGAITAYIHGQLMASLPLLPNS